MTQLDSGEVLVVGGGPGLLVNREGDPPKGLDRGAELYDPATGHWRFTSPMLRGHGRHTATKLRDGRVLVAGSTGAEYMNGGGDPLQPAVEIYDTQRDTWTLTSPLAEAREMHAAVLLDDGRVLVAGGLGQRGCLKSVELYDPSTESWTSGAPMPSGLCMDIAALQLPDHRVLVTGHPNGPLVLYMYDPSQDRWAVEARRPGGIPVLAVLPSGRVFVSLDEVAGTDSATGPQLIGTLYDGEQHSFFSTAVLPRPLNGPLSTTLADGRVLFTGGRIFHDHSGNLASHATELYDERSDSWTRAADLHVTRQRHLIAPLRTGGALVAGGTEGCYDGYQGIVQWDSVAAEVFQP